MRIWVDLTNSPHVLVLRPVIDVLRARGAEVRVTARDFAQTVELCARFRVRVVHVEDRDHRRHVCSTNRDDEQDPEEQRQHDDPRKGHGCPGGGRMERDRDRQGHAGANVADRYGDTWPQVALREIEKLPRYDA